MSSLHTTTIAGSLVAASFSAVMILSFTAVADDQGPGSSKGGKAVDQAPWGAKLTTCCLGRSRWKRHPKDGCLPPR